MFTTILLLSLSELSLLSCNVSTITHAVKNKVAHLNVDDRDSISSRGKVFLFASASRLPLGPTQTSDSIQWALGTLYPMIGCRSFKLTMHFHVVPLRMRGAIPTFTSCLHGVVLNWCPIKTGKKCD